MTTGNLPAYPIEAEKTYYLGLTKRELFAAMAMQGILSNSNCIDETAYTKVVTRDSIRLADSLIAELNKEVQSCQK